MWDTSTQGCNIRSFQFIVRSYPPLLPPSSFTDLSNNSILHPYKGFYPLEKSKYFLTH